MPLFNNSIREDAGLPPGGLTRSFKKIYNFFNPSRENVDKTIQANKEMAEYQYAKDLAMWEMGNKYNAPEAQMERLRQAGLNPNMIYGSGGATGNTTGQLPKYNAPNLQYNYQPPTMAFGSLLGMYQDYILKQAQTDNVLANNKAIKADADIKDATANWIRNNPTLYGMGKFEYPFSLAKNKSLLSDLDVGFKAGLNIDELSPWQRSQLDLVTANINQKKRSIELMQDQREKLDADTEHMQTINKWYVTKMFSELGLKAFGQITDLFSPGKAVGGVIEGIKGLNRRSVDRKGFNQTTKDLYQGKFGN